MNDTEKRRQRLLEQMRDSYSDRYRIPAVHPRYKSAYGRLYEEDEAFLPAGSLGVRTFLCVLLFTMFVAMDYQDREIMHVDSDRVVQEITQDIDVSEVWKNL